MSRYIPQTRREKKGFDYEIDPYDDYDHHLTVLYNSIPKLFYDLQAKI